MMEGSGPHTQSEPPARCSRAEQKAALEAGPRQPGLVHGKPTWALSGRGLWDRLRRPVLTHVPVPRLQEVCSVLPTADGREDDAGRAGKRRSQVLVGVSVIHGMITATSLCEDITVFLPQTAGAARHGPAWAPPLPVINPSRATLGAFSLPWILVRNILEIVLLLLNGRFSEQHCCECRARLLCGPAPGPRGYVQQSKS